MRTFLVSYATPAFASVRRGLNLSAIQHGISNILSYTATDLRSSAFYRDNQDILDSVCGAGYWAWKPYFILEALKFLDDGDVLFYCDAGSLFVSSPQPLVEICEQSAQGLVLFDARPLTNRQFTKRDCFIRLESDDAHHWDAYHVIATILAVRKTEFAMEFLREWLRHCRSRAALTDDPNTCGAENLESFLQHRHDQAILSVLAAKHGLETYRNPTRWGNFLKLPEYRVGGEDLATAYGLATDKNSYAGTPQVNSPYGTIFVINRQPNFEGKEPIPQELFPRRDGARGLDRLRQNLTAAGACLRGLPRWMRRG